MADPGTGRRDRVGATLVARPGGASSVRERPGGRREWWHRVLLPVHWSFLLSQVALWSFAVLLVTGVLLALLYRPGVEPVLYDGSDELYAGTQLPQAFASVLRITADVPGGALLRSLHIVATYLFLASLVGHLLRVLITGAFRRPRRVNYLLGVALLLLAVATSYSGHVLRYDLLSATSLRIIDTVVSSVPLVGEELALLLLGGDDPTTGTMLTRLWMLHVFVLPVVLVAGTVLHLLLVARQSHARLPRHAGLRSVPVPAPLRRSVLLGLLTLALLLASAALVPWSAVRLAGPGRAGFASNSLQPDWYMFWPDGAMRLLPGLHLEVGPVVLTNPFVAAVALPTLMLALLALYPWLEPLWRRQPGPRGDLLQHPFDDPVRLGLVAWWLTLLVVLSVAATDDTLARLLRVPVEQVVWVLRVAVVLLPVAVGVLAAWYARRQGGRWPLPEDQGVGTPTATGTAGGTATGTTTGTGTGTGTTTGTTSGRTG